MIKKALKKLKSVLGESLVEVLVAVLTVALSSALLVAGVNASAKLNNEALQLDGDFARFSQSAQSRDDGNISGSGNVYFNVGGDGGTGVVVNYYGKGDLVSFSGKAGQSDPAAPTVPVHTPHYSPGPTAFPTPEVRVKVTYYMNDGTSAVFTTQSVVQGEKTVKPSATPIRENYTFSGSWYKDSGCRDKFDFANDTVDANLSLYAGWTVNIYTVTFDIQGHGTQPQPQKVRPNEKATEITLSETGCIFGGWYRDTGFTQKYDFSKPVTEDFTLYAKWTLKKYTVTFDRNNHGKAPASQQVEHGSLVSRPVDPAKDGNFFFSGWYTDPDCRSEYNFQSPVTGSFTLYAKWSNTSQYPVTFHLNGARGSDIVKYVIYNGTVNPLPTVTRTGYTFDGWYTSTSYSTKFTTSTRIRGATDVYAKWVKYVTVKFDATDGTTSTASKSVLVGGTYGSLPEPVISDYRKFIGWFTAKSGGTLVTEGTSVTKDTDHTLYAHWSQPYTIEFDSILGWQDHKEDVTGWNEGQSYTWSDFYWNVISVKMAVSYKNGAKMTEGVDYSISVRSSLLVKYYSITFYPGVINGDIYIKASW